MTTTPEATPPAEQKMSVEDMLNVDGFGTWLEKLDASRVPEMTDAKQGEVEKLFKAWEASKAVAEKSQYIYNQKLASEELGEINQEEADEIVALIGNEALRNPAAMEARKAELEKLEKLPRDIAAAEAEFGTLAAKVEGIADINTKIATAKEKQAVIEKALKALPDAQLTVGDKIKYYGSRLTNMGGRTTFDKRIEVLDKRADPKDKDERDQLDKFRKYEAATKKLEEAQGEAEKLKLSPEGDWKVQFDKVAEEIKKLGEELKTKEDAQKLLDKTNPDGLDAKVKKLKDETAALRRKVCGTMPGHARVHTRLSGEVHATLFNATDATDPDTIASAVALFKRLQEAKKTGGTQADYLDDFGGGTFTLDQYQKTVNEQAEAVFLKELTEVVTTSTSSTFNLFAEELQNAVEKWQTGLGFKTALESRKYLTDKLEALKTSVAVGHGKKIYLNRLIIKLKQAK